MLQRGAFLAAGADILAHVDIDVEQARKAAVDCAVPYSYDSLDEALQKHEVDFVSICRPLALHLEQAMFAIRAGCHVLVEKPITSTIEDAIKLKRFSAESGRKSVSCIITSSTKEFSGRSSCTEKMQLARSCMSSVK